MQIVQILLKGTAYAYLTDGAVLEDSQKAHPKHIPQQFEARYK